MCGGSLALPGAGVLFSQPLHPGSGQGPYHNHLGGDREADLVHVAGVELLHHHQNERADEGKDE